VSVRRVRGLGSLLAAATAFGAVSVTARHAYESGSEPVSLLGVRLLLAALALSVAALRTAPEPLARRDAALGILAGLAFAAAGLGEFEALSRAAAPVVVVLVFVAPVWVALTARLAHGEALGWRRAVALAGILVGVGLLVWAPGADAPDAAAVAFALGASVMSAVFFLMLDRVGRRLSPRRAACVVAWAAAAAVVPLDAHGVAGEVSRLATAAHGVAIGALTAVALALLATAVPAGSALTASAVICVEPAVAGVIAWLLLGELLTPVQLAGGALVLLGVARLTAVSARAPPGHSATGRTTRPRRGSRLRPRPARSARRRRSAGHSPGRRE
jgi:drug/metabolite transporter (DMT)-like permease